MRSADSAALAKLYTKALLRPGGPASHLHGAAGLRVPWARRPPQPLAALRGRWRPTPVRRARGACPRPACRHRRVLAPPPRALRPGRPLSELVPALRARQLGPHHRDLGHGQLQLRACGPCSIIRSSARLELRVPGADTSPHHCLAMFLGAALWGIEERLEPPPPVIAPADGRRRAGRIRLPRDLVEAADTSQRQHGGPRAVRLRLRRALRGRTSRRGRRLPSFRLVGGTGPLRGLRLRRLDQTKTGDTVIRTHERARCDLRPRRLRHRREPDRPRPGPARPRPLRGPVCRPLRDRPLPGRVELAVGRDAADLTRQICNAWKSDRGIADVVLRSDIGRACALLGGWPGARLSQDNVLVEATRAGKALGFHQDSSYEQWAGPRNGSAAGSPSRTPRLPRDGRVRAGLAPLEPALGDDRGVPRARRPSRRTAAGRRGRRVSSRNCVPVEVPAGGGAFHDGWTWHGSGVNGSAAPRRSLVAHCMSSEARFHPEHDGLSLQPVQAVRRRRDGRVVLPDHLAPGRLPLAFLEPYLDGRIGWAGGARSTRDGLRRAGSRLGD